VYAINFWLAAGAVGVTVRSPDRSVTDWVAGYVEPWWSAVPAERGTDDPVVTATPTGFMELAAEVDTTRWQEVGYPRLATRFALGRKGTVVAVTPKARVGYRYSPATGHMDVCAEQPQVLARAAVRMARELVRAQLVAEGWVLLHASAAVWPGGQAVLALGGRGAGKSTVAFTLAAAGAGLLGNDRVFARPAPGGGVKLAPWPSGAAVGLGLLGALGWTSVARERLDAGAQPHPAQDARVTAAILAEQTTPVFEGSRELKAHLRPDELTGWFGLAGAATGRVSVAVFPIIRAGVRPGRDDARCPAVVSESDFMTGPTEDSYPDIFGLTGGMSAGTAQARAEVADRLTQLPAHALILGHDTDENAAYLAVWLRPPSRSWKWSTADGRS
jgi:hypothetical protein